MKTLSFGFAAAALLALGASANAQVWNEVGDAGQTLATAQDVLVSGPLTSITGSLTSDDADVFRVTLDGSPLLITTVGGASFDTILALFDASGILLAQNDDSQFTLQSTLSLTGLSAGEYLVGISAFPNFAVDGPTYATIGTGGGEGGPYSAAYTITFRGASGVSTVPEPGSVALLCGAGLTGGVLLRKRRKSA